MEAALSAVAELDACVHVASERDGGERGERARTRRGARPGPTPRPNATTPPKAAARASDTTGRAAARRASQRSARSDDASAPADAGQHSAVAACGGPGPDAPAAAPHSAASTSSSASAGSGCGDAASSGEDWAGDYPCKSLPYRTGLAKDEAPLYVTYPWVLSGYRCGGTHARCALALFEVSHPEALNAWTMIWAAALSLWLLAGALRELGPAAWARGGGGGGGGGGGSSWRAAPDALPFLVMTAAVCIHVPMSVGFHLFRGINPRVYNLWRRLDQVFIFQVSQLLTLGIGWFVYRSWWALAANVAAAVAIAQTASLDIWRQPPHFRRRRSQQVQFVGAIALAYGWPMALQVARDVWALAVAAAAARLGHAPPPAPTLAAAGHAAGAAAALFAGAAVFATGWPERAFPRVFDVVGFSHQLMHVAASASHWMQYAFILEMWRRRAAEGAAAS